MGEGKAKLSRKTKETVITLEIELYGRGKFGEGTGLRFFDHMLEQLAFYSGMDLELHAKWDLQHHLMEDTMFLLGRAVGEALGERKGIRRYGWSAIPMDESLVLTSIDLSGRPYYSSDLGEGVVEGLSVSDLSHSIEAFARGSLSTIHVVVLRKGNLHHVVEAAFKSLGLSLNQAKGKEGEEVRSTKEVLV